MTSQEPRVVHTELVRASRTTSLLRVDVDNTPAGERDVALVVRDAAGATRRIPSLPVPASASGRVRFAFGLPAADRMARLTLAFGDGDELPLAVPPERSREDAVASVALRRARERMAQLERELEERERGIEAAGDEADGRERLEHQLAEHRVLRAQLARELQAVRKQTDEMQAELAHTVGDRDRLLEELEQERTSAAAERERLTERLQAAHQRVEYLERRLVEVQAQAGAGSERSRTRRA